MPQYVVCLSVCLSVMFRYRDHIGSNISKIISQLISLRLLLGLTPIWTIWSNGNTPKLEWNGVGCRKHAISLKRCKIWPSLLWRTNRKSHTHFQLTPESMTLDDLERPERTVAEKMRFTEPRKISVKIQDRPIAILWQQKCRPMMLVSRYRPTCIQGTCGYSLVWVPRRGASKDSGLGTSSQTLEIRTAVLWRWTIGCRL